MTNVVGAVFDAGHEQFDTLTAGLWGPVGQATVDIARPADGEYVFDACCGAGASALPTAVAVGPHGRVDAVDLSERLVALGRSRAHDLPQVRFHHADVVTWGGGPYDLVQCVLGIFFLPDMVLGARAMAARLRPGGRFAVTVFTKGVLTPLPEILAEAVAQERTGPPASRASSRLSTPDLLTDLLVSAGLRNTRVETKPLTIGIEPAVAWALVQGSGLRRRLDDGLDAEAVERTRVRFQAAIDVESVDVSVLVGLGHTAEAS